MTSKDYHGSAREPLIRPVPIDALRPTQITVGFREVHARRDHWKKKTKSKSKQAKFLGEHLIPTILGPGGRHYILDHHHLVMALHQEGLEEMYVTVSTDLSALDQDVFWVVMDQRNWIHPFDEKGVRRPHTDIPKRIDKLKDDPFRSLAGELRRAGGFAKDTTLYSEFLWADFMRRRMKAKTVSHDFPRALSHALALAKSKEANYLPGWCGPVPL